MRHPGKTSKEEASKEKKREAAYYLWCAIPWQLAILGLVVYCGVSGNSAPSWVYPVFFWGVLATVVIVCTLAYGWRRTVVAVSLTVGFAVGLIWLLDKIT